MRKIILYTVSTIDGYIATSDGSTDLLAKYFHFEDTDYEYRKFLSGTDTILMDEQTYRNIICMDVVWPYKDKTTYIISHSSTKGIMDNNIHFITDEVVNEITYMKDEPGKNIGLVGGGDLTKLLLQNHLIDEMIISTVPILLGGGILLFPPFFPISCWNIKQPELYKNCVVQTIYQKTTS